MTFPVGRRQITALTHRFVPSRPARLAAMIRDHSPTASADRRLTDVSGRPAPRLACRSPMRGVSHPPVELHALAQDRHLQLPTLGRVLRSAGRVIRRAWRNWLDHDAVQHRLDRCAPAADVPRFPRIAHPLRGGRSLITVAEPDSRSYSRRAVVMAARCGRGCPASLPGR